MYLSTTFPVRFPAGWLCRFCVISASLSIRVRWVVEFLTLRTQNCVFETRANSALRHNNVTLYSYEIYLENFIASLLTKEWPSLLYFFSDAFKRPGRKQKMTLGFDACMHLKRFLFQTFYKNAFLLFLCNCFLLMLMLEMSRFSCVPYFFI